LDYSILGRYVIEMFGMLRQEASPLNLHPPLDYIKASRRWWIALVFHSCLRPRQLKKKLFFLHSRFLRTSVGTMKGYLLILLVSLVALAVADEKYTRKYDDVNVDKILQNNRVLTNYIRCLMDEGPCTAEGRELRSK